MSQLSKLNQLLQAAFARKPVHRPARAHGRRMLFEPIESRLLLSATLPGLADAVDVNAPAAIVVIDKVGYAPSETAYITASNFQLGETVQLAVGNGTTIFNQWSISDGGAADLDRAVDGSVKTSWLLPSDSPGHTYQATATGASTSLFAQASFEGLVTWVQAVPTDYLPGDIANIFTGGFQSGESVLFQITNLTTGTVYTPPWSVADGSVDDLDGATDGHIQTGWLVPQDALNTTLRVDATGQASGLTAVNTFTDAAISSTSTGGLWSVAASWVGGVVPAAPDNVTIVAGATITVDVSNATATKVAVSDNANGTATLVFNAGSQLTVSGQVQVGGNNASRLGVLNMSSGGLLQVGGAGINSLVFTANGTFTAGTGTVEFNGAGQTIANTTYNNLILSGSGTKTSAAGGFTATGPLTMANGVTLDAKANNISVGGLSTSGTGVGTIVSNATSGASTLTITGNSAQTFAGAIQDGGSGKTLALTKTGAGTQIFTGTNTYIGATTVSAGTLLVNGALAAGSFVSVANGATLGGGTTATSGTVAGTVSNTGALSPGQSFGTTGTGILNTGSVAFFNSTSLLKVDLNGITAGSGHDQLNVTGGVTIGANTALNVSLASGFTPVSGNSFVIVNNDGTDAVSGTFAGLAEGATFTAGGTQFSITYVGGTGGNDVVLAVTAKPTVTIAASDASASEAGANTGAFTVSRGTDTTGNLTVGYTLAGTATNTGDYSTLSGSVVILNGSTSATIVVTPVDDQSVEGSETVIATLATSANYTIGGSGSDSVTITDNDTATVTLSGSTTATESGATGALTATLNLQTFGTGAASLATVISGITLGANADYSSDTKSFSVGASNGTAVSLTVTATNDQLIEQSTQTFVLAALVDTSSNAVVIEAGTGTVNVVDNDSYAVSIVGGTTSVTEGALVGQNVQVTLDLTANGAAGGTLEVGVTANLPGSADYSSTAASFSAGAGDNAMANIVVSAVNDTLVEAATESFAGQAVSATSVATQSPVASGSRTIEVVEDDRATIALQTTSSAAGEAAGTQNVTAVLTITATGTGTPQLDRVVSVTVSDAGGGTATGGGTDYTATTKTLTFGIGSVNGATQTTSGLLSIVDDLLLEGGETINLTLGGLSDGTAGRVTLVAPTSHTATITDNESATLAIASTSSVTEQGGSQSVGVVTLTVSGTGSGTAAMGKGIIVTADVADLSNGTAFGGSTDYAAFATQTVTFNGGVSDGTVLSGATRNAALTPTNDTLVEGSETVNLNLQNLVKPATVTAILGSITNNTTTITDNDTATLSIEATKTVTEQGGAQTITVTLTTTDGGAGTATLAPGVSLTADVDDLLTGTATSGILNDYTAFVTQTVTFGPGSGNAAIRTVTLTPTNDAVVEVPDETVKLKLQNLNTTLNGQASIGNAAYSTVTISDNDTTSTLTVSSPKQYSDLATFTATLSPAVVQGSAPATSVTFYVGTQNMGTATLVSGGGVLNGTLTVPLLETVAGQMAPGARTVTAVFGGISANATVTSPTPATLNITQENANVTYTGQTFVTTLNATTTTVVVPLEAVIRDITAVNSGSDPNAGAILNATVTFKVFDAFSGSLLATISNPTIGLIGSDTKVALAQASYTVSLGNANAAIYRVETIVGGYYTADATASEALITVAKPIDYTINGGGYVIAGSSDGTYKADATSKMNFGINIGYNKSMTNVQGKVNAIFRHTEAGVVHTYQIKSNASGALSVDATTGVATFTAKANLTDITNAASPLPITGNFDMTLRVDDNGEPGTGSNSKGNDQFSLRLLNGTALVFASSWNGTQAALQTLDGGNIQVRPYSETLISFTNGTQGDQTLSEGMSGNKTMTFTVKLSQASTQTVKVNYTTADNSPSIGAATAGLDYVAASGTLTFAPGALTQTITVNVIGDTLYEPDETFFVNLSNPVGAGIQDPTAIGLITNDDAGPAPLHALGGAITSAGDTNDLSLDAVQPVLTAAIDYWRAQGADPLWLRSLDGLQVQIADLAGTTVGEASQGLIVLDHDAAGYGWSTALAEPLSGRVDLLSTLTHEVGHLLGLDHDVMGESLAVGVRVLPTSGQEFVYALQTADSTVASLPGQLGLPRALPVVADPVTAFASDQRTGPRAWVHDDKSASSRALDTTTVSQIDWTLGRSEARAKFDITPSSKRWIGDFVNHLGASAEQRNPNLGLKISLATAIPLSKGPNIL